MASKGPTIPVPSSKLKVKKPSHSAPTRTPMTDHFVKAEDGGSGIKKFPGSKLVIMRVANNKVDLLAGKGGKTIRNIEAMTGAQVQVIPTCNGEDETSLLIEGTVEQIDATKQMVNDVTSEVKAASEESAPSIFEQCQLTIASAHRNLMKILNVLKMVPPKDITARPKERRMHLEAQPEEATMKQPTNNEDPANNETASPFASGSGSRSAKKRKLRDNVSDELKEIRRAMDGVAAALDRGNESELFSKLFSELLKIEGLKEEAMMPIYMEATSNVRSARAFLALPPEWRATWLRLNFNEEIFKAT